MQDNRSKPLSQVGCGSVLAPLPFGLQMWVATLVSAETVDFLHGICYDAMLQL